MNKISVKRGVILFDVGDDYYVSDIVFFLEINMMTFVIFFLQVTSNYNCILNIYCNKLLSQLNCKFGNNFCKFTNDL